MSNDYGRHVNVHIHLEYLQIFEIDIKFPPP